MIKEEKKLFLRVFVIVVLIFFINAGGYIYQYGENINKSLTGNSINSLKSDIFNLYESIPLSSKIFFLSQWFLLFILLLYTSFKDKGVSKRKKELLGLNLEKFVKNSKTDLDTLYLILQEKKQISITTISKLFDIKKDLAMEWAKILESGNLAVIDYPMSGGAIIKIKKQEQNQEELKQEQKKEVIVTQKSRFLAIILSLFFGILGFDRFYLGYRTKGFLKLITIGGLGAWYLVDLFLIMFGVLKPNGGEYKSKKPAEPKKLKPEIKKINNSKSKKTAKPEIKKIENSKQKKSTEKSRKSKK